MKLTGMTLKEKSFRNMIEFYKPKLLDVLKSSDQHSVINSLPKSAKNTMKKNKIITIASLLMIFSASLVAQKYLPKKWNSRKVEITFNRYYDWQEMERHTKKRLNLTAFGCTPDETFY